MKEKWKKRLSLAGVAAGLALLAAVILGGDGFPGWVNGLLAGLGGAALGLLLGCLVAWIAVRLCPTFDLWVTEDMVAGSRLLGLLDALPHGVDL